MWFQVRNSYQDPLDCRIFRIGTPLPNGFNPVNPQFPKILVLMMIHRLRIPHRAGRLCQRSGVLNPYLEQEGAAG